MTVKELIKELQKYEAEGDGNKEVKWSNLFDNKDCSGEPVALVFKSVVDETICLF